MGDLKPIGSEKLQGQEKISRMLEIARYKEHIPKPINETAKDEYSAVLADGYEYHIVKEKLGYVIKKGIPESDLDYVEPMKNRKHYTSYSSALKRLNLIVKEQNVLNSVDDNLSLFGEQKKYTLNVPTKKEEPAPAPAPEAAPEAPMDDAPMSDEELSAELDVDMEAPEEVPMGEPEAEDDGEEVTFKMIQKLTGKLGQKVRVLNDTVGMTSEDVKYVLNSIVSALDLSKLSEEDKEDIITRIEEYEETPDMGGEMDVEGEMDMEFPGGEEEISLDAELPAQEMTEMDGEVDEMAPSKGFKPGSSHPYDKKVSEIMDSIFSESKVDKVLESYFVVTENEKNFKKTQDAKKFVEQKKQKVDVYRKVKTLCETVEQELASKFILDENKGYKFLGKTNKNNLVFENAGVQIKITPKGEVI